MSEIKPKFPPRVQAIWEDCGTYIDTGFHSNESAAKELEFFVEKLIASILDDCQYDESTDDALGILQKKGYL